jgi:hypothetical protein
MVGQSTVARPPARLPLADPRCLPPDYPQVSSEFLDTLPPVLRAIVRALGFPRAVEWLRDHGGISLYVPLVCGLGLDKAEVTRMRYALRNHMDELGRVTLPKSDKLLNHFRDRQIREERRRSKLVTLALRYHLTTRQVQNICNKDDSDPNLSLF